ncbi:MAG: tetratricopeptide repeat protein [Phycisphaerae bacterium]|nr:tetratricopeptide repeat protein [Phycisphaerae bacterium]
MNQPAADAALPPSATTSPPFWARPAFARLAPAILVVAGLTAYCNTFNVPWLFDDPAGITENSLVTSWQSAADYLGWQTPFSVLTFRINYLIGGKEVWTYHAINIAIHILAAISLFGVLRRTLNTDRLRDTFGPAATPLALMAALLWMLHPVQTQAVTYIVQRKESMMSLFYLLTIYCYIRATGAGRRLTATAWFVGAGVSCLLSIASKQVAMTAPLVVLLYDLVFLSRPTPNARRAMLVSAGAVAAALAIAVVAVQVCLRMGWPATGVKKPALLLAACAAGVALFAWRKSDPLRHRWWVLLMLVASWALTLHTSIGRFREQGMGTAKTSTIDYACTQPGIILHYIRLIALPYGLCFDPGWQFARGFVQVGLPAIGLLVLIVASLWLLDRRPGLGFWAIWFFVILAPTSSFIVIDELTFDHRLYLPSAGVVTLAVLGGYLLWRRLAGDARRALTGAAATFVPVAIALLVITLVRNHDYRTSLALWADTAAKAPHHCRARGNYGNELLTAGRLDEAIEELTTALKQNPNFPEAYSNRGEAQRLRAEEFEGAEGVELLQMAIRDFGEAVQRNSGFAQAYNFRGLAQFSLGRRTGDLQRYAEALKDFGMSITCKPDYAAPYAGRGWLRLEMAKDSRGERQAETFQLALGDLSKAIELEPKLWQAYNHRGFIRARLGKVEEAIRDQTTAHELAPREVSPLIQRGLVYRTQKKMDEALRDFTRAVELSPRDPLCFRNRADVFTRLGRYDDAITDLTAAIEARGDYAPAYKDRADVYLLMGERTKAAQDMARFQALVSPGVGP